MQRVNEKSMTMNVNRAEYSFIMKLHAACYSANGFNETEWYQQMSKRFGCQMFQKYQIKVNDWSPDETHWGLIRGGRFA